MALLGGIKRGITDLTRGIAAGSGSWPQAFAQNRQLELQKAQMERQNQRQLAQNQNEIRRIDLAEAQARDLNEWRDNQLQLSNFQIASEPLKDELNKLSSQILKYTDAGQSPPAVLISRQHKLISQYKSHLTDLRSNQALITMNGDLNDEELKNAGVSLDGISGLNMGHSTTPFVINPHRDIDTEEGYYDSLASANRRNKLKNNIDFYYQMAKDASPEVVIREMETYLGGGLKENEREHYSELFKSAGNYERYASLDQNTGQMFDKRTGELVEIPNVKKYGGMTKQELDIATDLGKEWRLENQIVRLYGMATLSHGEGWSGYNMPVGAGDFELLYALAKMLAPDDSAVREGEIKTLDQVQGFVRDLKIFPFAFVRGQKLEEDTRREIWMTINAGYRNRLNAYMTHGDLHAQKALSLGVDPNVVVTGWDMLNADDIQLIETEQLIKDFAHAQKQKKFVGPTTEPYAGRGLDEMKKELRLRFGVKKGQTLQSGFDAWNDIKSRSSGIYRNARKQGFNYHKAGRGRR